MSRRKKLVLILAVVLILLASPFLFFGAWTLLARHRFDAVVEDLRRRGEPTSLGAMLPHPIPPDQDATTLYQQAWTLFGQIPEFSFREYREYMESSHLAESRALLDSCSQVLDLVRRGALRPYCSSPQNFIRGKSGTYLPEITGPQAMARLLALSSKVNLDENHPDLAFDDCLTILHLPAGLHDDPLVISALVEAAINDIALKQLQIVVETSAVSPDRLRAALPLLERAAAPGRMARALMGERCFAIASVPYDSSGLSSNPTLSLCLGFFFKPIVLSAATVNLRDDGQLIPLADLPWHQAKPAIDKLTAGSPPEKPPFYRPSTAIQAMAGSLREWNANLARLRIARIALAIHLYQLQNQRYPDSLSQLVPDFLEELPIDPFTPTGFIYRPASDRFILYSVGKDLTDEDGLRSRDLYSGDIVWGPPEPPPARPRADFHPPFGPGPGLSGSPP